MGLSLGVVPNGGRVPGSGGVMSFGVELLRSVGVCTSVDVWVLMDSGKELEL